MVGDMFCGIQRPVNNEGINFLDNFVQQGIVKNYRVGGSLIKANITINPHTTTTEIINDKQRQCLATLCSSTFYNKTDKFTYPICCIYTKREDLNFRRPFALIRLTDCIPQKHQTKVACSYNTITFSWYQHAFSNINFLRLFYCVGLSCIVADQRIDP